MTEFDESYLLEDEGGPGDESVQVDTHRPLQVDPGPPFSLDAIVQETHRDLSPETPIPSSAEMVTVRPVPRPLSSSMPAVSSQERVTAQSAGQPLSSGLPDSASLEIVTPQPFRAAVSAEMPAVPGAERVTSQSSHRPLSADLPNVPSTNAVTTFSQSRLSNDVPRAASMEIVTVETGPVRHEGGLPAVSSVEVRTAEQALRPLTVEMPAARSSQVVTTVSQEKPLSVRLPAASSAEVVTQTDRLILGADLPVASSAEVVEPTRKTWLSPDVPVASSAMTVETTRKRPVPEALPAVQVSPETQLIKAQLAFDGQLVLDDIDPFLIGAKNFKTLQNIRYVDGALEGVAGYSKISTNPLTTITRDDISFSATASPDNIQTAAGDFLAAGLESWMELTVSGSASNNGTYSPTGVTAGQITLSDGDLAADESAGATVTITAGFTKIRAGHQLRSDRTQKSYVLVNAKNASGQGIVVQNQGTIPSQANFEGESLHTDASDAGDPRFSGAPEGIAYCNGKESCIWAGEETRLGGFFLMEKIEESFTDLTFDASADTIKSASVDFIGLGFRAGQRISITACSVSANVRDFTIKTISDDGDTNNLITVVEDAITSGGAGSGTATIEVVPNTGETGGAIVDYTDAANNTLQTEGNIIPAGEGLDSYTKALYHFNGVTGSTSFPDETGNHDMSNGGGTNAAIHGGWGLNGLGVLEFDSNTEWIEASDHADFQMGTDEFTIDFRFWFDTTLLTQDCALFQKFDDDNNCVFACYDYTGVSGGGFLRFIINDGGTTNVSVAAQLVASGGSYSPYVQLNNWNHVAIIRGWLGDSDKVAVVLNGHAMAIADFQSAPNNDWPALSGESFEIGRISHSSYACSANGCWFDEFRVSKGIARWTDDFTPPVREYGTELLRWMIFTLRPAQAFKYYVKTANTETSTLSAKCWTGQSWQSVLDEDGTSSGGKTLAQTGIVTLDSTVNSAQPFHFAGLYLYAYMFKLSDGSAEIYHVSADLPFQPIRNVWDGVFRQIIACQFWDDSAGVNQDFTLEVNYPSNADTPIGMEIGQATTDDFIEIFCEERLSGLIFSMIAGKENTNLSRPSIFYWDGEQYTETLIVQDGTIADENQWKALGKSGLISWFPPTEHIEVKKIQFGVIGYAYKITFSDALSGSAVSDIIVDTIYGVPAESSVKPFKFSMPYKDQLLLCGFTEGKEGNRVDYCMPNAVDVWNGALSSMSGGQSLYFGGREHLTCGIQLYNRYGSSILSVGVLLKDSETYLLSGSSPDDYRIYPISFNIGCPAPATLDTAETGYEISEGFNRNIALWLSASGPVMFDGSVLIPIRGLEKYFDPENTDCVNFSHIHRSIGWYDPTETAYNLLFPSGSGQEDCNTWAVYDLKRKRWYFKKPPAYPQAAFPVRDEKGTRYIYGGLDTGYLMNLRDGTSWDGTGIEQIIETGDFLPSNDIWDVTRLRKIKLVSRVLSESADLYVLHFADGAESASSVSGSDFTFTTTDTITRSSGDFLDFRVGQTILPSGTTNNDKEFEITEISADGKTLTVTGETVTTESPGAITISVVADVVIALDSGSNRIARNANDINILGWSHRFRFSVTTSSTVKGFRPLMWGYQFLRERDDE